MFEKNLLVDWCQSTPFHLKEPTQCKNIEPEKGGSSSFKRQAWSDDPHIVTYFIFTLELKIALVVVKPQSFLR